MLIIPRVDENPIYIYIYIFLIRVTLDEGRSWMTEYYKYTFTSISQSVREIVAVRAHQATV